MRLAGHVERLRKERSTVHTGFWRGKHEDRDCLEDLGVDGVIILQWILNKSIGSA
jgi:hypothetical protein